MTGDAISVESHQTPELNEHLTRAKGGGLSSSARAASWSHAHHARLADEEEHLSCALHPGHRHRRT